MTALGSGSAPQFEQNLSQSPAITPHFMQILALSAISAPQFRQNI